MELNEYQKLAGRTADFSGLPGQYPVMYCALGLAGETGELIEKIKKTMRNDNGVVSPESKEAIKREMGDVLWYLSQLAHFLDITFEDVGQTNIEKIADRAKRGVIKSEGDNR
jgi:NTP pyrophosphatase (non-canonical NTP hydrolase)